MTVEETLPFADWLRLREPADAAARAEDLLDAVRPRLAGDAPTVIHDLGSGTGSMSRWLAPRLPGPQHWVLHDRDADLLARAAEGMTGVTAADGAPVTVEHPLRRPHPADRRRPGRRFPGHRVRAAGHAQRRGDRAGGGRLRRAGRPCSPSR